LLSLYQGREHHLENKRFSGVLLGESCHQADHIEAYREGFTGFMNTKDLGEKESQPANMVQGQMAFRVCPFCNDTKGLYVGEAPKAHPSLRYQVECVCGASGAPRETPDAARDWWNTRKGSTVGRARKSDDRSYSPKSG
jgi:hypothetical protein